MTRRFFLVTALFTLPFQVAGADAATIKVEGRTITFRVGDQLVGQYQCAADLPQPHFHPLLAPTGKPITRAYPMVKDVPGETKDHEHHRGVWFCHGDVIAEGLDVAKKRGVEGTDLWSVGAGHGRIVCKTIEKPQHADGRASVVTTNEWQTGDGTKLLDEVRQLTLAHVADGWLLVVDVDLRASAYPITFGDTKEGSFAVRVADAITEQRKQGGTLENAEGKKGEKACWGQHSAWCDYSGPIDGQTVGLAIFDHPKNPSPASWHARGYGLMAANPFGRGKSGFPALKGNTDLVKLAKGDRLKLRYGLFVHKGDATSGNVARAYQTYLDMP
jgi:hypothetical protein